MDNNDEVKTDLEETVEAPVEGAEVTEEEAPEVPGAEKEETV